LLGWPILLYQSYQSYQQHVFYYPYPWNWSYQNWNCRKANVSTCAKALAEAMAVVCQQADRLTQSLVDKEKNPYQGSGWP